MKTTRLNKLAGFSAFALMGAMGLATGAMAQSSSQNEAAGATTGLGSHHRFHTVAAASDHCPGDTIVWSSGAGLTYKVASSMGGTASHGFFACKAEADDAGFHQS